MYHRPFEDWLLDEEPLTTEQDALLQEHLRICESCRQLSQAWQQAEVELHRASTLAPQAGFADRWQARYEIEQLKLHRRQVLAALGFSLAGTTLLFGSLILLALPVLSYPKLLLWAWVLRVVNLVSYAGELREMFFSLFNIQTGMISIGGWVMLAGLFSMLVVVWIVSLRLLTAPRRVIE
jgi:hypothetical protein